MILGQKVFTRGRDIIEYRMFLSIKEIFNNIIPDEEKVCSLFQTTTSESRNLIKSVLSKYQYELKESLKKTLIETLNNVKKHDEKIIVDIYNENLKNEFNKILSMNKKGNLMQITKISGTVATYDIPKDSYEELCKYFKIDSKRS
jgi:hypothetical protein